MKTLYLAAMGLLALLSGAQGQAAVTNAAPFVWGTGVKILIVSGGGWHDFDRWFNKADTASLEKCGFTSIHYTESSAVAVRELSKVDVLISSANAVGFDTPELRKAYIDFANSGKGMVLIHSGVWHNWPWVEYNTLFVGGGANSHEGPAPFEVKIVKDHPVTQGLPASFQVTDELYHTIPDPAGTPTETLAEAVRGGERFPSVWLVNHPKARIVGIALGHDGNTHNQPEYQKLLCNAVTWVSSH